MIHSHAPSAAARSRAHRRGSVLLMVVAVLALLAIIAVSYTTLGRADRAASAALVREARLDDQAAAIGDYLAGIIGDDVLSTMPERVPGANGGVNWVWRREVTDYPSTDTYMVSDVSMVGTDGQYPFDPRGRIVLPWNGTAPDLRFPGDPWLASDPEDLRHPTDPSLAADPFDIDQLRRGTLRNISNFGPDGRFVNLVMLRPTQTGGGFDADPWRMTDMLTVYDENGEPGVPGGVHPYFGGNIDPARPADFTTYQRFAHRPMTDGLLPGDLNHIRNQWADTDGDGFADARWFELVEAFDRNNPNPRWILPRNGRARLFIAARAFDLSGRVNLNTACDFYYEPQPRQINGEWVHFPAGLTPADIDLRRLLSLNDAYFNYGQAYDLRTGVGAADYSGVGATAANLAGRHAYAAIRHALNTGEVLASTARAANDALVLFDQSATVRNPTNPNPMFEVERARFYDEFGSDPSGASSRQAASTFLFRAPFGLDDELELRAFHGVNDSEQYSRLERVADARYLGGFGPFRSNRPRSAELEGRPNSSSGDVEVDTLLADLTDVRKLLTTVSGARPLTENPLVDISPTQLSPLELKLDALDVLRRLDPADGTLPAAADLQTLFEYFVSALMPYTDSQRYPDAWNRSSFASRGLSYGEAAELAQRICAHLVANLTDAIDSDAPAGGGQDTYLPTRVTLEASANATTADPTLHENTRVLRLRDNLRAPDPSALGGSSRLNIYGIEPQPFLIEVGWTGMFTDAPYDPAHGGSGADDDFSEGYVDPTLPGNPPEEFGEITINFAPNRSNKDFLFEVVAFQLNNPFDHDIHIAAGNAVSYYVEFSNRYFALSEVRDDGSTYTGETIKLPAYGTRVFYAVNIKRATAIAQRIQSAIFTGVGGTPYMVPADFITQWARAQFGQDAVRIPMVHQSTFNIAAGTVGGGGVEFVDLFAEEAVPAGGVSEPGQPAIGAAPTSTSQREVAYLWRVYRPTLITDARTDIMLDRIRDPSGVIWSARSAPDHDEEISGTEAGNDTDGVADNERDNTGFSMTKWAAFRRPTGEQYARGSMPAWALEAKGDNSPALGPTNLRNATEDESAPGDRSDYIAGTDIRRDRLEALLVAQTGSAIINANIQRAAESKTGNQLMANRSGKDYNDAAVQIHISSRGKSQLFSRVGDFLLPLAIGPSCDPMLGAGGVRVDQLEAQWMTLGEALALASDYYSPPADDPNIAGSVQNPLYALGHSNSSVNPPIRPRLDRGNLVLNDFVPYIDEDGDGAFSPMNDQRLGRGVPLAYNLVELFKTTSRWKFDNAGNLVARTRGYGDLNTRIPGLININTAPLSVLRLIPMFAPDPDADPNVWVRVPAADARETIYDSSTTVFDFASMVAAYRDKNVVNTRRDGPNPGTGNRRVLDFRDVNDGDDDVDGRFWATRIAGIREEYGFRSASEILALRYHDLTQSNPTRDNPLHFENSVDRFANNLTAFSARQSKLGLESTLLEPDPAAGQNGLQADELENDYDEQLTIANAALNCITVRSDVFCVYFVIHGYLPSDVENLGDFDPLVPSIARRYVMVVDRSNVTTLGQKPRILMFQELPIR